jgi:hypothetical protein
MSGAFFRALPSIIIYEKIKAKPSANQTKTAFFPLILCHAKNSTDNYEQKIFPGFPRVNRHQPFFSFSNTRKNR